MVTGNCSAVGLAAALQLVFPDDVVEARRLLVEHDDDITAALSDADAWIAQASHHNDYLLEHSAASAPPIVYPAIVFSGFHPDLAYAWHRELFEADPRARLPSHLFLGVSGYHSAIGLWAWRRRLSPQAAAKLFTPVAFTQLGYSDVYREDIDLLREAFETAGLDFSWFWLRAKRLGVFMHTIDHPRVEPIALLAKLLALRLGMPRAQLELPLERHLPDDLVSVAVWPVYPEIARHLGVTDSYLFSFGLSAYSLKDFLKAQWSAYGDADPAGVYCPRLEDGLFDSVLEPLVEGAQ